MNSDNLWGQRGGVAGILAIALCLCALACALPNRACAQSDKAPSERAQSDKSTHEKSVEDAQSPEYRELIEQALSEFKHKNWPESRVLFRKANDLSPNARAERGIGMVSYEMRDYVAAVVTLSQALGDARQALTDSQRKECETLLARSRTFVGAYSLKLEPPQAEVTLDGAPFQRDLEGRVLVPFGEHALRATAPGFQDSTSKLSVQGGETGELRIVLYRPQAVAAAPAGGVDKTVAAAPLAPPPMPVSSAPVHHNDHFVGHGIRYSWIALGATAAFGAAAAATWFVGQKKVDDLDSSCARTGCQRGSVDVAGPHRYEHATTALLGLAGAGLVATAVLMSLEWPTEKRRERASMPPRKLALDLGPQRLSVRGSF